MKGHHAVEKTVLHQAPTLARIQYAKGMSDESTMSMVGHSGSGGVIDADGQHMFSASALPTPASGIKVNASPSPSLPIVTLVRSAPAGRSVLFSEPQISPVWAVAKRLIDIFGSIALIALLSPVLIFIYAGVARSGKGVIFGHHRLGRGGKWFTCYKFRTMVPDAHAVLERILSEDPERRAEWLRDEKLRDDPRVTSVGEFLRKSSLDELPQLFNVLKGDMSLVGPRPATDIGMAHYGKALRWYLAVRPGMTGLWQVSGRNEVGFRRRVVLDVYYVRAQSFLLDIQILFRTFRVVFRGNGY